MIEWFVTAPNPKRITSTNADSGQTGWRLHAVDIENPLTTLGEIRCQTSACGRRPAHGWELDLFITETNGGKRCKRCERALAKNNGVSPYPFRKILDKNGEWLPIQDDSE